MADDMDTRKSASQTTVRVETIGLGGGFWFAGWLFTIGFAHLDLIPSIVAVVAWPFYLGVAFR